MFNSSVLKKLRKERGYTLKQVAEFVGVTIPYVSSLEKGKVKNPSYSVVESIAKLFRLDPKDFLFEDPMEFKTLASIVDIMALREIRLAKQWSVNEAANRAGVNPSTLSLIENGKRRSVSMDTLSKLEKAYGVDVGELLLHREEYVDLTALVLQSDTVIINGEEIDVRGDEAAQRIITSLKMGAAWAKEIPTQKVSTIG